MHYIESTFNLPIASLSIAIAVLAAYIAIEFYCMAGRIKTRHQTWLFFSAFSLGLGLWSMHAISMFSYEVPLEIHYEVILTLLSLLLVIVSCYIALRIIHFKHTIFYLTLGGVIMGAGISSMHYMAIDAIHIHAVIQQKAVQIMVSIGYSISASLLALWLLINIRTSRFTESTRLKLGIAAILGISVSSIHYSGVSAMKLSYSTSSVNHTEHMMMTDSYFLTATALLALTFLILPLILAIQSRKKEISLSAQTVSLKASEERLRVLIEGVPDAFFVHNLSGKILDVNRAACVSLGYTREELLTLDVFSIEIKENKHLLINTIWPNLVDGQHQTIHGLHQRKDGSRFPVEVNITKISDENEQIILALARDVTELEELKAHLHELAMTDELTNIYNRRAFMEYTNKEFSKSERNGSSLSTLIIDLDRFKAVNDTYGHQAGDMVLQQFTTATQTILRNGDLFGRLGGEEFGLLLPATSIEEANILAERIRKHVSNTRIQLKEKSLNITVSIGVACLHPGMSLNDLFHNADMALYQAKQSGRDRVVNYQQQ